MLSNAAYDLWVRSGQPKDAHLYGTQIECATNDPGVRYPSQLRRDLPPAHIILGGVWIA